VARPRHAEQDRGIGPVADVLVTALRRMVRYRADNMWTSASGTSGRYHGLARPREPRICESRTCRSRSRCICAERVLLTQRTSSSQVGALSETPTVLVVDDDVSVREGLNSLFKSVGMDVKLFASAPEMLRQRLPDAPCCLVLDIRLPGVSGLDFQTQLTNAAIHLPIIMVTGHGDIPMSVRAMKAGAVDFLTKPFREQEMLDAVANAIETGGRAKRRSPSKSDFSRRSRASKGRSCRVSPLGC
jgi:FixJ family two-component response regulator